MSQCKSPSIITNQPQQYPTTTTKVLVTSDYLNQLFDHITLNDYPSTIRQVLLSKLPSHVSIIRDDDLPMESIDLKLQTQVGQLQTTTLQLSHQVEKSRVNGFSTLCELMADKHTNITSSNIPISIPSTISHTHSTLATNSSKRLTLLHSRIQKVALEAKDTRKRADRIRHALQIISRNSQKQLLKDNNQDQENENPTLPSDFDWTDTFQDLVSIINPNNNTLKDLHSSPNIIPKVMPFDPDNEQVLSLSPFITPRSKMRKRMVKSSLQAIPKLHFSPVHMR